VVGSNLTQEFWIIFNIQTNWFNCIFMMSFSVFCDFKCSLFDNLRFVSEVRLLWNWDSFSLTITQITVCCASYLSENNIHDMMRNSLCSDLCHDCTSHWECFALEEYRERDSQQKNRTVSYKILTNKINITAIWGMIWTEKTNKHKVSTDAINRHHREIFESRNLNNKKTFIKRKNTRENISNFVQIWTVMNIK
jgi:hypothetical protein